MPFNYGAATDKAKDVKSFLSGICQRFADRQIAAIMANDKTADERAIAELRRREDSGLPQIDPYGAYEVDDDERDLDEEKEEGRRERSPAEESFEDLRLHPYLARSDPNYAPQPTRPLTAESLHNSLIRTLADRTNPLSARVHRITHSLPTVPTLDALTSRRPGLGGLRSSPEHRRTESVSAGVDSAAPQGGRDRDEVQEINERLASKGVGIAATVGWSEGRRIGAVLRRERDFEPHALRDDGEEVRARDLPPSQRQRTFSGSAEDFLSTSPAARDGVEFGDDEIITEGLRVGREARREGQQAEMEEREEEWDTTDRPLIPRVRSEREMRMDQYLESDDMFAPSRGGRLGGMVPQRRLEDANERPGQGENQRKS